ncbi:MAG: LEA type 2 family protein [Granulosicoccus sp.]|nr:LEA type 2 family protein [Granulosicoccus sp.]
MRRSSLLFPLIIACLITGCATLSGRDSPDVRIVGLEPLPSEGLELRFALKMRVINPNDMPIAFDGLAVKLDLDGRGLASGVTDAKGEIPRFGEQVLTVPVSISAFSAFRQFLSRIGDEQTDTTGITKPIGYSLSGKLGGGSGAIGSVRFSSSGELDLFSQEIEEPQGE